MNLVFIYGPPAAGKLTVSKELSRLTGYKLYDNHAIVTPLAKLFPFANAELSKARQHLGERIRIDVYKTAAEAGLNLITTCGRSGANTFDFFRKIKDAVETNRGRVLFVQLTPPKEILLERVEEESRKGVKAETKSRLEEILALNPDIFDAFPDVEHLRIDNSNVSPVEAAQMINDYYQLTRTT